MVSGSLSGEGNGQASARCPLNTYTATFYEAFPYYLAIGMTPQQFWEEDCTLVRYFRKADEIKRERKNQELWLAGMYTYEAICDASPILHSFAKKGAKPLPYPTEPYALTEKQVAAKREEKELAVAAKGKRMLDAFMAKQKQPKAE